MGKSKETETPASGETELVTLKQRSIDEGNGIVVFDTDAPDGTGFTALIDGDSVDAKAEKGQVWFYVGRALRSEPIIELK